MFDVASAPGAAMGEFTLREMSMNFVHVVRGAVKGALVAWTSADSRRLLVRLLRDEAGTNLVLFAVLMPVLVGIAGLGTEGGLWLYTQQALQGAADSAAISAARAYGISSSANITTQAEAVTASNGFVNGTNGVTVAVNRPPTSGTQTSTQNAIEVVVTKSLNPLFSSLWFSKPFNITSVAVAIAPPEQCVLALDGTAGGAISLILGAVINVTGCGVFSDSDATGGGLFGGGSIYLLLGWINPNPTANSGPTGVVGTVDDVCCGINPTPTTGDPKIQDPYANYTTPVPTPPGTYTPPTPPSPACTTPPSNPVKTKVTLLSSKNYCGPITVDSGGQLIASSNDTFTGGIIVDALGTLTFNSGGTYNLKGGITSSGTVTLGSATYKLEGSTTTPCGTASLGICVTGGQLTSNSGGTYNVNGGITVSGGAVTLGSGTYTVQGGTSQAITVTGGTITVNPGTYTLYGNTAGSTTEGGISVSGGGTLTSNPGTYTMTLTGGTSVNGGTVTFGSGTFTMSQLTETNSTVTLNASSGGTYIFNSTSAQMLSLSNSTLTSTVGGVSNPVTLVFNSNSDNYPGTAMQIADDSTLNLTAPTTGATAGIALFGDNRLMPVGTQFTFDVRSTLNVTGAFYVPRGSVTFGLIAGDVNNYCTQIIADTIQFIALAGLQANCATAGTLSISSVPTLVE
jgi:hypothetical protein